MMIFVELFSDDFKEKAAGARTGGMSYELSTEITGLRVLLVIEIKLHL